MKEIVVIIIKFSFLFSDRNKTRQIVIDCILHIPTPHSTLSADVQFA